jgi:hypothetical protein
LFTIWISWWPFHLYYYILNINNIAVRYSDNSKNKDLVGSNDQMNSNRNNKNLSNLRKGDNRSSQYNSGSNIVNK